MISRRRSVPFAALAPTLLLIAGCAGATPGPAPSASLSETQAAEDRQVLQGRLLVINHDCGACHGGNDNPAAGNWLVGDTSEAGTAVVGSFRTWARNLTPDDETGLGRVTERQIFNALRYGLRPSSTPDVEITSAVPGQGNHPARPDYLAPSMPWLQWRNMTDQELSAIAAYLKRAVRPVRNQIRASEAPADLWASEFTVEKVGTHVMPPFPTEHEELRDPARRDQVLRGRTLVSHLACSACHGGALNPARDGWLTGIRSQEEEFQIGSFKTRPRNLTPDNTTGLGRFSERQIFNSLRYGLRPGETADIEITSVVPGEGNHPANPKYLAPPMPWPAWRHLSDDELWAIAAYLKNGVKPVSNRVMDSEGPPDFWLSEYTSGRFGTYPAPAFPTGRERVPERNRNR